MSQRRTGLGRILFWGLDPQKEELEEGRLILQILVVQMMKASAVGVVVFLVSALVFALPVAIMLGGLTTVILSGVGMIVLE